MIRYDEVFPLLLGACPSYAGSPEAASFDHWDGHYVHMRFFVAHLVHLLAVGDTEHFPDVFGVAERVLTEGDDETRSLMTAGFLRDLTSLDLYGETSPAPSDLVPWLGPEERRDPDVRLLLGSELSGPD